MVETYSQVGGVQYGIDWLLGLVFPMPFATLKIFPDAVAIELNFLNLFRRNFTMKKAEISSVQRRRMPSLRGIRFHHSSSACPPYLIFSGVDIEEVIESLQRNGISVTDSRSI